MPTAWATIWVPASKRCGGGAYVVLSMVTTSTMDPPVTVGGMASSSSRRPYSAPTPVGPSILWPLNAAKSTPSSWRSTGMFGTDWQASSTVRAPTRRAAATRVGDGRHGTGHVRDVPEGQHLGVLGDYRVEVGQVEPAVVSHRDPAQDGARAGAQLLPRDEVRVVLGLGDDYLVARREPEPRGGLSPRPRVALEKA